MAQTRGFSVDVMPRYTPVDPSLVAFNPQSAISGFVSGQDILLRKQRLAAQEAELQAFLEEQQEKRDLKDPRVARLIAELGLGKAVAEKGMRQLPTVERAENAELGERILTAPVQGDLTRDTMNAERGVLGRVFAAKGATADAARTEAEGTIATAGQRTAATRSDLDRKIAENVAATSLVNQKAGLESAQMRVQQAMAEAAEKQLPAEHALKLMQLQYAVDNAPDELNRQSALQEAELFLKNTLGIRNLAEADYARGLGRQAAGRPETQEEQLQRMATIQTALRQSVASDGRALKVYLNDTRDEKGNIKTGILSSSKVPLDPVAERAIEQLDALGIKMSELLGASKSKPTQRTETTPRENRVPRLRLIDGKVQEVK